MTTERRNKAVESVLLHRDKYRPDFAPWLMDNFHIYEEFERRALRIAKLRKHYSARTIVEVMRHDSLIGELNGEYKINDHATPDMARLFAEMNPVASDLFEFRRQLKVAA